ncbi:MAG: MraY family glycosyltransferase [Spirochaetia bacterium]|jgi:UDP-GlcNAc:undecaprenyl-phosphate GlcNAc-1-phosphate transferase|nr:MraY family glycosyltransferase [Spirochaetia bacterium]
MNLVITPLLITLSHKKKWFDIINERKIHSGNIPRIGGLGIFVSFIGAVFIFLLICKIFDVNLNSVSKYRHLALAFGFLIVTLMGIADDFIGMRAWHKFLIQTAAALIVTSGGFNFQTLYIPFAGKSIELGLFSHIITIFWIISLCNAVNLMDGMDGLAGGIALIASFFYGIIFYLSGNYTASGLSFALMGAVSGFLVFNFPPAKIFMGDSGSLFLGFSLAVIPLINKTSHVSSKIFFMPLIILAIPALDMIAAILRRKRRNLPISSPDREHIHHKLIDFGLSQKKILLVIYLFSVFAGLSGLFYIYIESLWHDWGFIVFSLIWALYTTLFITLHYKNQKRKKAALK